LAANNLLAELLEFRVANVGLPAQQNGTRMKRDHRPSKLSIADERLLVDEQEK